LFLPRVRERQTSTGEMAVSSRDGGRLVCVTGGSGYIGSWLVRLLLDRGYTVHATVQNLQDEGETKHLQALDGADTRLRLFQMDLLDPASIKPPIEGVDGVFHVAAPVILHPIPDPETEQIRPTVDGTLSVLRAAKDCGVKRFVMMSSQGAVCPNPNWPADKVVDEDCWADVEIAKKLELWYSLSKTLAEKAAWDFARDEGLEVVALNPGVVLGPPLGPKIAASLGMLIEILGGKILDIDLFFIGCVDVRDVAQSMLVLYENKSAQGRHLCTESAIRLVDLHEDLAYRYPELPVQRIQDDKQGWVVRSKTPSKKLMDLGVRFTPSDKTITELLSAAPAA